MPSPADLKAALDDIAGGGATSGLEFLVAQAIERGPEHCYLPTGVALIRKLAASKGSEARDAEAKFKTRYGKDFSPRRFQSDIREARAELTVEETQERPQNLITSESGKILVGYENAVEYFHGAPEWTGVLGYNEFTGGIEILKTPPLPAIGTEGDEIDDVFDTGAARWLERRSSTAFKRDHAHHAIEHLARENRFHPVKQYLEGLKWDGVSRLTAWLADYCGADPGSDEKPSIAEFVGRMFLISAVARIYSPGCQVDHMLVWEGKTGTGKSSAAKALVPREGWFTDQLSDLSHKDVSQEVRGVWIIELAELDAWTRADEKTAKRFISRRVERFRQPYERRPITTARQCVFIGTTEKDDWSSSETMRRQWPVKCTTLDVVGITRDRDQLWAEAVVAFHAGEKWHPDREQTMELGIEQGKRYSQDVWKDDIIRAAVRIVEKRIMAMEEPYVTIREVLSGALVGGEVTSGIGVPVERIGMREKMRVGAILRMAKWPKSQKRLVAGDSPSEVYWRP